jgi:hypothetical protein
MSLNERLAKIEALLFPEESESVSQWSYEELREIIGKTDLTPDMQNQGLMNVGLELERVEQRLDDLGHTDAHQGEQTLEERLNIIEGGISILCGQHLGYTPSDAGEFRGAHGFEPAQVKGDVLKRLDGIQKKVDRITLLLKDAKVTMSGETALRL